ncbi:NAD(P)/FAD-dependent oxidoreductase [Acidithiobacillus sp. HP-6]|uniref:NAD(P)-binding domain-containing protein n=1 Tax=unclassified Acidithiobacillus TaxID=2614800 RepID=UPI001879C328|nr:MULTISPECIES: NAD(P)/FAD-dependent oxidoreductase [unclassified Acidithiobacillus]MBE7562342.1 NAD(P)/FAD-dependent oxidoreductase [Acidithiobacillus sp. HP-6]MBE7569759.1 NAD(P)/FAD-dependent oxidoreductase [Acidithiobacillus sp. HP-2]
MKKLKSRSMRLEKLETQVKKELEYLLYPKSNWVKKKLFNGTKIVDVLIIGGGQNGISLAFRLMREGVNNIKVIDQEPKFREGPWTEFARMKTLRSPKYICGPEYGFPSLSFRYWWEAIHGVKSWFKLDKIPKVDWHEYLQWFKKTTGVEVLNGLKVTNINPISESILSVNLDTIDSKDVILARNVVFANGIEGCGTWYSPKIFHDNLPAYSYSHSSESINFNALTGKRVAIIGGGASAFDNAAVALDHGASKVELFIRRKTIPKVNPNKWMEFSGFLRHYSDLDDEIKWKFMNLIFERSQPPTQDSYNRCIAYNNFYYQTGCNIQDVSYKNNLIKLTAEAWEKEFDYLIIATGFIVDLSSRPELRNFHDVIATWGDKFKESTDPTKFGLERYPYLSSSFQFTEKLPGSAPFLRRIYCYNYGAMMSLASNSSITVLKFGIDRLCYGITKELFLEDSNSFYNDLLSFDSIEFMER